jgi:hypothetical protein
MILMAEPLSPGSFTGPDPEATTKCEALVQVGPVAGPVRFSRAECAVKGTQLGSTAAPWHAVARRAGKTPRGHWYKATTLRDPQGWGDAGLRLESREEKPDPGDSDRAP